MQVPSIARGFIYPTILKQGCPKYSRCKLTNKCQSYNKHCRLCAICETRVRPNPFGLGGCLPEGEFVEDVQVAMKVIQEALNTPFAHPDTDQPSSSFEIEKQIELQKANETVSKFFNNNDLSLDEQTVDVGVRQEELDHLRNIL